MGIAVDRLKALLVGHDFATWYRAAGAAALLFVAVFSTSGPWMGDSLVLWARTVPLSLLVLIAIAFVFAYYHEAVIVAMLLTIAPVYAFMINIVHLGNTGPNPYPDAVIMAVPWGVAIGGILGLIGAVLGIIARRYRDELGVIRSSVSG